MCIVCFAGCGQGWLGAVRNQYGCMGKYEALCHHSKSRKTFYYIIMYTRKSARESGTTTRQKSYYCIHS